ncbi:glycoside hydrolase family 172 protein [Flagellimonas sp.]|uniref:glycoside hydrolase family 172 protein n=1 Tax=Flagellimonas sp. TaxID=2058762 RepID=UPI003BAFE8C1
MKNLLNVVVLLPFITLVGCNQPKEGKAFTPSDIEKYYLAAPEGVETRWISSENKKGEKGKGGLTNKGAKGDAFSMIGPKDTLVIFDQQGPGIITKIWAANSFGWSHENRRKVSINMYWDGESKPAVSAPFTDFFGIGLGLMRPFENTFFSMPEGRSFNCAIPMPFRKSGRIEIVNESDAFLMFYYKVNMVKMPKLDKDAMYFHAYWNRDTATTKGVDYTILPKIEGKGRYMGTNIGVVGNEKYRGTWFGEGEVKIYKDGDSSFPTLAGTGTEDYIGTGWGQGEYNNMIQGSTVSNKQHDIYTFYRFHTYDPVYFHEDCRVTIQQIGNSTKENINRLNENGADITPVWAYVESDGYDAAKRYMEMENPPKVTDEEFPSATSTNFYRSDDVSATAYFYLDRPSTNLPSLPPVELRMKNLKEKVYGRVGN